MSKQPVLIAVCLAGVLATAMATPDNGKDAEGTFLFGLPFLQFTNGGVRVNFGGYHAEAGLGGLLGGSRAGGGLHASAGTPWGAHAGAGLGGILGGDDGSAGGGLYARAGLGPGMPEAGAGLGGMLDGSGRSAAPIAGGLYAGATLGDDVRRSGDSGASASGEAKAGANGSAGASAGAIAGANAGAEKPPGRTSIQIISRRKEDKSKAALVAAADNAKEVRRDSPPTVPQFGPVSASAGLFGAIYADNSAAGGGVKVKSGEPEYAEAAAPAPAVLELNEVQGNNEPVVVSRKTEKPRWRLRRRFWVGKQKYFTQDSDDDIAKPRAVRASQSGDPYAEEEPVPPPETSRAQNHRSSTFFDDVMNIPQSTLGAVNGFLNNNAG